MNTHRLQPQPDKPNKKLFTPKTTILPASSKWPFDIPNVGHLTPEKVTWKTQKGHSEEPGTSNFLDNFS